MQVIQQLIVLIIPFAFLLNTLGHLKALPMNIKKQGKQEKQDGFSSDQQLKHEQIIVQQHKKTQVQVHHKQQVKFKIPPPEQIKAKSYSLNPDIVTGWQPKNQLPVPIPMLFGNKRVDSIVKRFLQKTHDKMRLIYLGPRFQNTFYAWYDKQFEFPYEHIKSPHNMKFTNRAFCGQHWDAQDGLIFDSFFQSGNLDLVIQVAEQQYDIYMRVDSNTRGHLQWFNFKVKNLQKLQKYKFNICNMQKNKSLYSRGQKPFIFSTKKYEKQKKGWQQSGQSIKFQQKLGKSAKILNYEYTTSYKLSFQYYSQYAGDSIQIAYCIPYTYTQMLNHLKNIQNRPATKKFFTLSKLCLSLGGLQIPLVTIDEDQQKQTDLKLKHNQNLTELTKIPKKCIIISGRVHPGQSNGSYMMHGFLQFLCGQSRQAKMLRQYFVFRIVPMLNPDGVTLGNYRTGISGLDFNREYRNPDKAIFPQVYCFKKLVIDNKAHYGQNLLMFLDFHGHSTKKNVFAYGPQFPIIHKHYYQCRVFPKLLGNHTNMFRYYSCSFKVSQFKQTTARAIFLRKVVVPLSYTIQASNGSYYDHQALKDVPFNQGTWVEMGRKIGQALAEYGELVLSTQRFKIEKLLNRKNKKDIKIRKTLKVRANQMQRSQMVSSAPQRQINLLAANTENQKIKKIFEEIKTAQQQKQFNKNQQDEISQGSSDGQGEKDDLSPQKLNLLFQIIKNKKANVPQKHKKRFMQEQSKHSKTNQFQQCGQQSQILKFQVKPVDIVLPLMQQNQIFQQQQMFKPNANMKGHFLKSKNNHVPCLNITNHKKKQKIAARIINFSFVGHVRPTCSLDKKNISGNRGQYSQPNSPCRASVGEIDLKSNSKTFKVLDLSDKSFRQTCTSANTNDSLSGLTSKIGTKTFFNVSPRKLGAAKLQQFKYKRLFIDDFKI